ncbi:helix-turn-helix domain-containing protein [Microcoleus sp. FACHB-672]|uniref:helix-turn-helix domain-containing protein n=1 Tax=Microcoleus sp. FACHB-672 TaxID=2692825 RepID=UPI001688AE64|nr:helix-turn-helix transcriptional regulator [Microcoleus sp. FACHB-672]MBD2039088.1 helix-turn-helix transcriptional regulator [Microcoleus sp. FACHB-672]
MLSVKQPELGNLMRQLRINAGLTQEQFAAKLGVSFSTLNRWENGHSTPSPLAMQIIEQQAHQLGEGGQELLKHLGK